MSIDQNLKKLRKKKGLSQEELAEKSALSLRTIQRIEANATIPRGDSLQKIAAALAVPLDELADGSLEDDQDFLKWLNLSALSFLIFPLLGIIVPLVIWVPQKSRILGALQLGRSLINFQLTWVILLFSGYLFNTLFMVQRISAAGDISPGLISPALSYFLVFFALMYMYNFSLLIINSFKIPREGAVWYGPSIPFIR
jgi:transcriptional regulator with XRE-family HTH domain